MTDQAENLRTMIEQVAPRLPHKARRIAFVSGKGGVGKTTVSVNIALAMAKMRKRTILIDCDLGLANADVLLGLQPRATLDNLLTAKSEIRDVLVNLPSGLWLLPGAGSIVPRQAVASGKLEKVVFKLDDTADFILMDAAAGIDEGVQYIARICDEAVIIATPDSPSTINAYRLIKILLKRKPSLSIRIILNKAPDHLTARRAAMGLIDATKEFLQTDAEYVGWIPYDVTVEKAARERRPLIEKYPGSEAARAIVMLANKLLEPPPEPPIAA